MSSVEETIRVPQKDRVAIENAIKAWLRGHQDILGNAPRKFTGNYRLLLSSRGPEWTEPQLGAINAFVTGLKNNHPLSVERQQATQGIALQIQYARR